MRFRLEYLTEEMTTEKRVMEFEALNHKAALAKVAEVRKRGDDPEKLEQVIEIPIPDAA